MAIAVAIVARCGGPLPPRAASATSTPSSRPASDRGGDREPQVLGERVARLPADVRDVERARLGERHDGVAVDRADVDVDARGQADDGEAHAPVDERDVEVERAVVQRVDGEPHGPDVEVAIEVEGRQRGARPEDGGEDHERRRRGRGSLLA